MPAQKQESESVPVSVDTFIRAETDAYFGSRVKESGIGNLFHFREVFPVEHQSVIRGNRDTLYSTGVFDLDAGPVTLTLPDSGERFRSLFAINNDHYVSMVAYDAESYTFSKREVGTRYVMLAMRTLVDPANAEDVKSAHALQDATTLEQDAKGSFEAPNWDHDSQKKVRDALLVLASTLPDASGMFGAQGEVDPIRHLIGTAFGWGGNPDKEATYLNIYPEQNDGTTPHTLTVPDEVPVDGFWSISVYNADGYFVPNALNAYSLNNLTATKDADSSIVIRFGACESEAANCLQIFRRVELHGQALPASPGGAGWNMDLPGSNTDLSEETNRWQNVYD